MQKIQINGETFEDRNKKISKERNERYERMDDSARDKMELKTRGFKKDESSENLVKSGKVNALEDGLEI